jgi:sugar phosphate isomerase/epimerase
MNFANIAIHQGTLKHLPADEFLITAAERGFKNFSLWLPALEEYVNSCHSLDELKQIIAKFDLNIIEISPLHDWAVPEIHKICQIAQQLNAEYICAPTTGKYDSFEHAVQSLIILADIAASYNVKVAVEFVPQQQIDCLSVAWKLIQATAKENVGILLDTILFFLGPSKLLDLDNIQIEKIFLVHLADLPNAASATDFLTLVRNYRVFPGFGDLNLRSLINKLQQKNYNGYYSLEILNKEFAKQDAKLILQHAFDSVALL